MDWCTSVSDYIRFIIINWYSGWSRMIHYSTIRCFHKRYTTSISPRFEFTTVFLMARFCSISCSRRLNRMRCWTLSLLSVPKMTRRCGVALFPAYLTWHSYWWWWWRRILSCAGRCLIARHRWFCCAGSRCSSWLRIACFSRYALSGWDKPWVRSLIISWLSYHELQFWILCWHFLLARSPRHK